MGLRVLRNVHFGQIIACDEIHIPEFGLVAHMVARISCSMLLTCSARQTKQKVCSCLCSPNNSLHARDASRAGTSIADCSLLQSCLDLRADFKSRIFRAVVFQFQVALTGALGVHMARVAIKVTIPAFKPMSAITIPSPQIQPECFFFSVSDRTA